jgi:hypothetical protein
MKAKLLMICLTLSLLISGCGTRQPLEPTFTPTPQGPERVFYNYIVSVKEGADIGSSEAFMFTEKMIVTANVTTLPNLQDQMPKGIQLEITENGPFQFCTFTFSDKSQIIFEFVLKD